MQAWQGIDEFVSVVEQGSFTKAGQQLQVSTAHVSRSINALEKRLAVKLLHRSTRQVSTTATGQIYYQQCRQLLDGLLDANRTVNQLNTTPSGLIKITAPIYYGERIIAPLFNRLLQQYPDIELDLQLSNHNVELISEGFDLAIRLGSLADSSLMARRIGSRHFDVVASKSYFARCGQPHTIDELNQHNCLRGISDHWHFDVDGRRKDLRIHGSWRCNSGLAVARAAMDGIGIAQLPHYYTDNAVEDGRLMRVLEQHRPHSEGIWAVYPQNRHLSTKLRVVIDFLAAELGEQR
ncbi:LysR family transcriptional regulator [Sinobacterium caligoides]|uniref:LysR family transcriptional regulator n=1 Tax=Sinobacterium caligoides TaxID=933926 RepID=A0A3N2DQD6_9GAMM|nr:LysR family transcriptional regulator [Sinobacterium caligoides]ROS01829.1 LysR family transcriptional regulator [Sinobacterium caligoides]